MSTQILRRRSDLLHDRPFPIRLGIAELTVNINPADPGLYFPDSTPSPSTGLIKVGPIFVGTTQPNNVPIGFTLFSRGESWLDKSSTDIFKIYDGSAWVTTKAVASVSVSGFPSNPVNGQLHYDESAPGLFIYRTSTASWSAV